MPDKRISDLNSLGTTDDNDYIEVYDVSEVLPSNQNKKLTFTALKNYVLTAFTTPLHKNTHVVGGTDAFVVTDLLNAVAKVGIRIANILIGQRRHINFIAGSNITITALDDNINEKVDVIINSVSGNVGDITGGLNVGTGQGVFLDKVGNNLRHKTLVGTGITTITTNVNNEIVINTPAPGNTVDVIQNVGAGNGFWKQTVGNVHDFKSAVGSSSITITNNSNDLTFVANDLTTISHVGGGLQIATKTLLNTEYNTFSAGANMSIVPTLGNYVINTSAQPNAGLNLGSGSQVFKQVNAGIPEYRTITNGVGITLSSSGTEVNIVNSLPMISGNFLFTEIGSTIIQGVNNLSNTGGRYSLINPVYNHTSLLTSVQDFYLNGNYNKIIISTLGRFNFTGVNVYIENVIFDCSVLSGNDVFYLASCTNLVFKNCTFIYRNPSTTNLLNIQLCFDTLFDNCTFQLVGNSNSAGFMQFSSASTKTLYLKNCTFSTINSAQTLLPYNLIGFAQNVTYIGTNNSNVNGVGFFGTVIGSLNLIPTLTYIV
jgi:hypothetical protein